ncbi:MAG: hypothetical protein VKJ04_07915 [Vampirovibrionales bacterium]|nr:hypothetical protein [Vampirovibrionales bacterium]
MQERTLLKALLILFFLLSLSGMNSIDVAFAETDLGPDVPRWVDPYSKQIYLSLPAYLYALEKEKQEKKAEKAAEKARKKAEKSAKVGDIVPEDPQFQEGQDVAMSESSFVRYMPYDAGKEFDLWRLEAKRFFRSEPVLTPDHSGYAYTEVSYLPHNRQTFSRLFWVPYSPSAQSTEAAPLLPGETPETLYTRSASGYQDPLNPDKTTQLRQEILGVGNNRPVDFEFRTLTIVDWSANSRRLLFKQRTGVLHVGLKVSDILVYDRSGTTVTIFPELQRVLQHYWMTHSQLPDLDTVAWDIYPMGWAPGSDAKVLFKAWAFNKVNPDVSGQGQSLANTQAAVSNVPISKTNMANANTSPRKVFLGVWEYDIDAQRSRLLGLEDANYALPVNGEVPDFIATPSASRLQVKSPSRSRTKGNPQSQSAP